MYPYGILRVSANMDKILQGDTVVAEFATFCNIVS